MGIDDALVQRFIDNIPLREHSEAFNLLNTYLETLFEEKGFAAGKASGPYDTFRKSYNRLSSLMGNNAQGDNDIGMPTEDQTRSQIEIEKIGMDNINFKGVDISHWQGSIDWKKAKDNGVEYAIIKATEGGTYKDPLFLTNWNNAKNNLIHVGAYHYFRALSSTANEQVCNVEGSLIKCNFNSNEDILAIDVEKRYNEAASQDQIADVLFELLTSLTNNKLLNGKLPYIYCSPKYWETGVNWQKYDFSKFPLWVAHWNVDEPYVPQTWKEKGWKIWQTSSTGVVPGIAGAVDTDIIRCWISTEKAPFLP